MGKDVLLLNQKCNFKTKRMLPQLNKVIAVIKSGKRKALSECDQKNWQTLINS